MITTHQAKRSMLLICAAWVLLALLSSAAAQAAALEQGSPLNAVFGAGSQTTPPLVCTPEQLQRLSASELRLMRNFVFARHGRAFAAEDLKTLFNNLAWYRPDPSYSDARLGPEDKACVDAAAAAEARAKSGNAAPSAAPAPSAPMRLAVQGGYRDATGTLVLQRVGAPFSEGLAAVGDRESGKTGYLDTAGKMVIKATLDEGGLFSEGFAAVRVGKKWGFIDRTSKRIVRPRFALAREFHEGRAWVWDEGAWSYVDVSGNVVIHSPCPLIPCQVAGQGGSERVWRKACSDTGYVEVKAATGRSIWLKEDAELGFVGAPECREARDFSEGLAAVQINGQFGFIDRTGTLAVPAMFTDVGDFSEGVAWVFDSHAAPSPRYFFIDKLGREALQLPRQASGLGPFRRSLAAFSDNGSWGFIDRQGRIAIPPRFEKVEPFDCELAAAKMRDGAWGLIDRTGAFIVPPRFSDPPRCYAGFLEIQVLEGQSGVTFWIDGKGNFVGPKPR